MKVNCSTCRETWGASSGQPPRALRVVAAMRGSFRPPGGRFDMQPPSRGVDITTLADWSESVDAGPKVGVGVSELKKGGFTCEMLRAAGLAPRKPLGGRL